MNKHGNSKYRPKYAKDLRNGLRKDGLSIEEVCSIWGVTVNAYNGWRKTFEKFEEAHLIGEQHKIAWWRQVQRDVACGKTNGNAGVINMALKNEAGYVDKQEVEHKHEEQIRTIKIEMLPTREQLSLGAVLEGEYAEGSDSKSD